MINGFDWDLLLELKLLGVCLCENSLWLLFSFLSDLTYKFQNANQTVSQETYPEGEVLLVGRRGPDDRIVRGKIVSGRFGIRSFRWHAIPTAGCMPTCHPIKQLGEILFTKSRTGHRSCPGVLFQPLAQQRICGVREGAIGAIKPTSHQLVVWPHKLWQRLRWLLFLLN